MASVLNSKTFLLASVFFILLAGVAFTLVRSPIAEVLNDSPNVESDTVATVASWSGEANDAQEAATDITALEPTQSSHASQADAIVQYVLNLRADDIGIYNDFAHNFSFHYPKDFMLSTFEEGSGSVIVGKHPQLHLGFQIYITPLDEDGPITKERILRDIPTLTIKNETEYFLDDDTPSLRFTSEDPALGETREIWFLRNGYLYQIMMFSKSPEWLDAWSRQFAS